MEIQPYWHRKGKTILYMSLIVGWWTQMRNNTKKTAKMSHTVTSREIVVTLLESKKTV